jgi:Family of unknown function (DUF6448)
MDAHHDATLAHAALAMAVAIRGGNQAIAWVVMHTDQGSEHTAGMFRQACTRMGIKQSMGSAGSALDNAVIGSCHSTFEFELRGLERFAPVGVSATLRRRVGTRRAATRRLAARPCSTGHAARPTTRRSLRRQQTRKSMEGATMPPHCDSLDGPVVTAARRALDAGNVDLVLPFVHAEGEEEVRSMFERALAVRHLGPAARVTADQLFFETVVRVHRAGEGAPFTGLKPAGLSVGPVIPVAEHAVTEGSAEPVVALLAGVLREELEHRMDVIRKFTPDRERSVEDARRYVEAMLDFEVYSHHVHEAIRAGAHHDPAAAQHTTNQASSHVARW